MMKETFCLLTACIEPPAHLPFNQLKDPTIRRTHYIKALNFYLNHKYLKIVFCENSGHDLTPYFEREIDNGQLEILTFQGNNYPLELGKGMGEFNCINHAMNHSAFIAKSAFVFKITGRYIVKNFEQFVRQAQKQTELWALADLDSRRQYADARFFGLRKEFLSEYLKPNVQSLNDSKGYYFEHLLFRGISSAIEHGKKIDIFNGSPRIIGIAGSMNQPYKSSQFRHLIKQIKGRIRYRQFHAE